MTETQKQCCAVQRGIIELLTVISTNDQQRARLETIAEQLGTIGTAQPELEASMTLLQRYRLEAENILVAILGKDMPDDWSWGGIPRSPILPIQPRLQADAPPYNKE